MTLEKTDSPFKTTPMSQYGIGDYARLDGEPVRVVAVNGKRVQVAFVGPDSTEMLDEAGAVKKAREWVDMAALKDDLPADVVGIPAKATQPQEEETPSIAEREMNLAAKKDRKIEGLLRETAKMSDMIDEQARTLDIKEAMIAVLKSDLAGAQKDLKRQIEVHENWLALSDKADKAQKEHIEALATDLSKKEKDLAEVGAAFAEMMQGRQPAPTAKRKIETVSLKNPEMRALADLINEGWKVVFETVYVMGGYEEAYNTHFLRLEREALDIATPPQDEARQAVAAPVTEMEGAVYHAPTEDLDETPAPTHEITFHVDAKPRLILPAQTNRMYEAIDPKDIDLSQPLAENVWRYGHKAVGQAQNLRIMAGMQAVEVRWHESTQRLFGGQTMRPAMAPSAQMSGQIAP